MNSGQVSNIAPLLNNLPVVQKWNFDLEDCDKILRVDSCHNISRDIPPLLHQMGHECIELE